MGLARGSEQELIKCFSAIARKHSADYEIHQSCKLFAQWCEHHLEKLEAFTKRHGSFVNPDPARVRRSLFHGARTGPYGLLRDLQDLLLLTHQARTAWTDLMQAAKEMKESDMVETAQECAGETDRQIDWLCTQIKVAAPQTLTVPVNLVQGAKDSAMKLAFKLVLGTALVAVIGSVMVKKRGT
jgi:hypothetical protein